MGAGGHGLRDKVMPVVTRAAQGDVQGAGKEVPRVLRHAADKARAGVT
jgi:hypothetical protein